MRSVPSEHVNALWSEVAPHLRKVVEHFDEMDLEEIRNDLLLKKKQLYVYANDDLLIEWAMVTEVKIHRNGRKIVVNALGGKNFLDSHLEKVVHFLREWGKEIEASVEIPGREGWKRALKPLGGRVKYIIMEV